jgi:hypothetical protein
MCCVADVWLLQESKDQLDGLRKLSGMFEVFIANGNAAEAEPVYTATGESCEK